MERQGSQPSRRPSLLFDVTPFGSRLAGSSRGPNHDSLRGFSGGERVRSDQAIFWERFEVKRQEGSKRAA